MFTPQEVKDKSFSKSTFGGYNMAAVDEFLDTLTNDYSTLYTENASLKSKLKMLAEKVEEYRDTEDAMRSTLLAAQRLAAQTVQEAQAEKEQLLNDARAEHESELKRMRDEAIQMRQRMNLAKQELNDFVTRSRKLCEQQVDFFSRLPEMDMSMLQDICADVADKAAQTAESSAKEETEPDAENTVAEETVTDSKAEETSDAEKEPSMKIPPFPSDDLTDLKFGTNYNGDK